MKKLATIETTKLETVIGGAGGAGIISPCVAEELRRRMNGEPPMTDAEREKCWNTPGDPNIRY